MNQNNSEVNKKRDQGSNLLDEKQESSVRKASKKGFADKKEYFRILKYMQQHYPKAFTDPLSPLALGIHIEIRKHEAGKMSNNLINKFLYSYTRSKSYKNSIVVGASRVSLIGKKVAVISDKDMQDS